MGSIFSSTVPEGVAFALESLRRALQKEYGGTIWFGQHELKVHSESVTGSVRSRVIDFNGKFIQNENWVWMDVSVRLLTENKSGAWNRCMVHGLIYEEDRHLITWKLDQENLNMVWEINDVTVDKLQKEDQWREEDDERNWEQIRNYLGPNA